MYIQLRTIAVETVYGEDTYGTEGYATTQQNDQAGDGLLANTGQDMLLFAGLGLIIIAVSLFALLRRRKQNKPPKIG